MNRLTLPLAVAFLYFVGAMSGWVLEFIYRNLISHQGPKGRYFINPGFCKGPWLPIYGIGIAVLCIFSEAIYSVLDLKYENTIIGSIIIILILGFTMNCIEFIGGICLLKFLNMRLWDYSNRPGNYKGIVCPLFACIWTLISAIYYLFLHQVTIEYLSWFSKNLAFAFFVGLFWGFFILDLWTSFFDAKLVKEFADDRDVIVHYEELKAMMLQKLIDADRKQQFFNQVVARGLKAEDTIGACIDSMSDKLNEVEEKVNQVVKKDLNIK